MTQIKGLRRSPNRRTLVLIALAIVAVALYAVLVPIHAANYGTVLPVAMLLGAGLCVAPLLSISHPRIAILVVFVTAFTLPLVVSPERSASWPWPWSVPALIAFAIFVIVITVLHGWRIGIIPLVLSVAGSLVAPLIVTRAATGGAAGADLIVTASIASGAFLVAVLVAGRIRVGEQLSKERELTALEQSRRELVEERARIARELHDVIAHSMSLIQVQASTARYRIPGLPEQVEAEFEDIAGIARGSLTEMRRLLGVLRTEDQAPQLAPQQGIADIPGLVSSIRRAGADVVLSLTSPPIGPPPSVQITAFRIVQEALSNAVRHAPGSGIAIELTTDGAAVSIRVHNDAATGQASASPGAAPFAPVGAGHGLRGMQERVALLDGSLTTGPDPAGGWTVTAVLPWSRTGEERV
ncbi:sensor histidine kinase [Microbacterium sp. STN6]|uniref:sensor histidine kinase n=1 Tax=Microbacterium sp. STN6 TaxID=2995588 RepID=UPI002260BB72|nr:sensor histidine kinase [Microbacterium sp. STN6]MCX7522784.1 sensor histidine kinase [Microbacterium sp. STN6]